MSAMMTRPMRSFAALLVMAVAMVAYGKFFHHSLPGPTVTPDQKNDLEIELITLRPEGFEPLQITRPKGPFVLLVDDRSGKEGSTLKLVRVNGEQLRSPNTNRKKSEWYDVLDLQPGDYLLSDTQNPERRCQITLLP